MAQARRDAQRLAFHRQASDDRRLKHIVIAERRRSSINAHDQKRIIEEAAKVERRRRQAERLSSKYPKQGVVALKEIFDSYDANGDAVLDRKELYAALDKQKRQAQRYDGRRESLADRQARRGVLPGRTDDAEGLFLVDHSESMFRTLDLNDDALVHFEEVLKVVHPLATPAERLTMVGWTAPDAEDSSDGEETEEERRRTAEKEAELRKMFNAFDRNHDGAISLAEFKGGMCSGGWEDEDLRKLFAEADTSGDGVVDFEEFRRLMDDCLGTAGVGSGAPAARAKRSAVRRRD